MRTRKLAFYLTKQTPFFRDIVENIGDLLQHHPEWSVVWQKQNVFWNSAEVWRSGADAVICGNVKPGEEASVQSFPGRVISVSNFHRQDRVDAVVNDDREVGRVAARHLTGQGFRQIAFVNFSNAYFSRERFAGAREIIETYPNGQIESFRLPVLGGIVTMIEQIRARFAPPLAIYCDNDLPAIKLATLAPELNLRIPEEAALLGTDNSRLLCQLCRPRLSSVALDSPRISQHILELITQADRSHRPPKRIEVPPLGVVTRHSTDITAVDDPRVAQALVLMRQSRGKGLSVEEIAQQTGLSRRSLEQKCKALLQRSPYQEMLRLRIDHARELLRQTTFSIGEIAERIGFDDLRSFNHAFHKQTGQSPREYRKMTGHSRDL